MASSDIYRDGNLTNVFSKAKAYDDIHNMKMADDSARAMKQRLAEQAAKEELANEGLAQKVMQMLGGSSMLVDRNTSIPTGRNPSQEDIIRLLQLQDTNNIRVVPQDMNTTAPVDSNMTGRDVNMSGLAAQVLGR